MTVSFLCFFFVVVWGGVLPFQCLAPVAAEKELTLSAIHYVFILSKEAIIRFLKNDGLRDPFISILRSHINILFSLPKIFPKTESKLWK